jgi:hypothetical protein
VLESLDHIDWAAFSQPANNHVGTVPCALLTLSAVASDQDAIDAYHKFLFAVGNDHAGTYYPVVVPTIQFLGEIVAAPADHPANAALEALSDLMVSFQPEPGHEHFSSSTGSKVSLRDVLADEIRQLSATLNAITGDAARPAETRRLAADLLKLL